MIPPLASMSSSPLPWSAAGSPLHDLGGAAKEKRGRKTSQERPTNNSLLAPEEKEGEENCVGIGKKREKKRPRVSIVVSYTVPCTGVRKSFLTLCYTRHVLGRTVVMGKVGMGWGGSRERWSNN